MFNTHLLVGIGWFFFFGKKISFFSYGIDMNWCGKKFKKLLQITLQYMT